MNQHPNLQFTPNHSPLPKQHAPNFSHHETSPSANVIVPPPQIPLPSMLSRKRKAFGLLQTDFGFNQSNGKSDTVPQILPSIPKDQPLLTLRAHQRRSTSLSALDKARSSRVNSGQPTLPRPPLPHPPLQQRVISNSTSRRQKLPLFDQSDDDDVPASQVVRSAHPKIWDTLLSNPLRTSVRKNYGFGRALLKLDSSVFDVQECPSSSDEDGPGLLRSRGHVRAGAGIFPVSTSPSTSGSYSVSRVSSAASLTTQPPEIVVQASSVIEGSPFAGRDSDGIKSLNLQPQLFHSLSPYGHAIPASPSKKHGYSSSSSSASTISSVGDETSSPCSVLTTPSTSPETSFLPHLKYIKPSPLNFNSPLPQPATPCVPHSRDPQHLDFLPVEPGCDPLSLEIVPTRTNSIAGTHATLPKQNKRPHQGLSATSLLGDEIASVGAWDALCGFSKLYVDGYGASTWESSPPEGPSSLESSSSESVSSAPSVNFVFTPWDVKPYGYRVAAAEVRTVFGRSPEEAPSAGPPLTSTSETIMNWFDSALDFVNPPMDAAYGLSASASVDVPHFSGSRGAFGPSLVAPLPSRRQRDSMPRSSGGRSRRRAKHEGKRPPSPPLAAIVALQRYPVIPYNPPGDTKPWEEVFPKVRDTSRIWWFDMMPASEKDFKIDGDVAISSSPRRSSVYARSATHTPSRLQYPYLPSSSDQSRSRSQTRHSIRRKRSPSSDLRSGAAGGLGRRRRSPSTNRRHSGFDVPSSIPRLSESSRGRSRNTRAGFNNSAPNSSVKRPQPPNTTTPPSNASSPSTSLPSPALVKRKARLSSFRRPPSEHSFAPSIYYIWALKTSLVLDRNLVGIPPMQITALARTQERQVSAIIPVEISSM